MLLRRSARLLAAAMAASSALANARCSSEPPPGPGTTRASVLAHDIPGYDARPHTTCVAFPAPAAPVKIEPAFGSSTFTYPTRVVHPSWGGAPFYVLEKNGLIKRVEGKGDSAVVTVFADLTPLIPIDVDPNESGVLGMAFDPNFQQNGQVFLSYSRKYTGPDPNVLLLGVITRAISKDGGLTLDMSTQQDVLAIDRLAIGHNGGNIAFGPDGYLYAGFGDGNFGDWMGNAQNDGALLGKVLRLDVSAQPYAIPPDNPFAQGGGAPEIYAKGFRNPWCFSFDPPTGDLWLGDVGHDNWEEVDVIHNGGNYGWNVTEGDHCFGEEDDECDQDGLTKPLFEYSHLDGAAITGGYVYRGKALPSLAGKYVFGDFGFGTIWELDQDALTQTYFSKELLPTGKSITSFATDDDGELYFTDIAGGVVYELVANDVTGSPPPGLLSQTGCVDSDDPTKVPPGVIPYDVNVSFWSDGAGKERYLSVPDDEHATVLQDGELDLPAGSVLMKTFLLGGKRIETRLMVHHGDVGWAGYTYEWNDQQTDATLLDDGKVAQKNGQDWLYPGRAQCMFCHTSAANRTLGMELDQLDRDHTYPNGRVANQLTTLYAIGVIAQPPDPQLVVPLAPIDSDAPLNLRVRSWLHVNCSNCHRPSGPGGGSADFRIDGPSTHLCNVSPVAGDQGVAGAKLVVPGEPDHSLVLLRAGTRESGKMPPLGSFRVDDEAMSALAGWIAGTSDCE